MKPKRPKLKKFCIHQCSERSSGWDPVCERHAETIEDAVRHQYPDMSVKPFGTDAHRFTVIPKGKGPQFELQVICQEVK